MKTIIVILTLLFAAPVYATNLGPWQPPTPYVEVPEEPKPDTEEDQYPLCWNINEYFWRCRDDQGRVFGVHVYQLDDGVYNTWCEGINGNVINCPW